MLFHHQIELKINKSTQILTKEDQFVIILLAGETKAGSAGEQPARESRSGCDEYSSRGVKKLHAHYPLQRNFAEKIFIKKNLQKKLESVILFNQKIPMIRKIINFVLVLIFSFSLFYCALQGPIYKPPPPRKEVRPHRPGPIYMWVSGHHEWRSGRWVWINGHWVKRGNCWV